MSHVPYCRRNIGIDRCPPPPDPLVLTYIQSPPHICSARSLQRRLASWTPSIGSLCPWVCQCRVSVQRTSVLASSASANTAERINETAVRASVGVSRCLIAFLQGTPCQVDCLCVQRLCRRVNAEHFLELFFVCACVCVCMIRYYKAIFHEEVVRFTPPGGTKWNMGPFLCNYTRHLNTNPKTNCIWTISKQPSEPQVLPRLWGEAISFPQIKRWYLER